MLAAAMIPQNYVDNKINMFASKSPGGWGELSKCRFLGLHLGVSNLVGLSGA